jgi:hypothetical protein
MIQVICSSCGRGLHKSATPEFAHPELRDGSWSGSSELLSGCCFKLTWATDPSSRSLAI